MQSPIISGGWIKRGALALTALLLLASLAGCAQGERQPTFVPGTYTKTITEADVKSAEEVDWIGGEWIKEFNEDGSYIERYNGDVMVRGTYTISGDQITTVDASGPLAGVGDEATSTFHWVIGQDGALQFSDYPNDNRLVLVVEEGQPWTRVP